MATSSITKNFVISGKEQVEMFVNAIEESAKNRPVRTPVAARQIKGEEELLGYFSLALKPLTVRGETVSNTTKRKLLRISELDESSDTYNMSAYLIAQLGKNYTDGANQAISRLDGFTRVSGGPLFFAFHSQKIVVLRHQVKGR